MKRKASPSPKASAYFSLSESGESDVSSRRNTASPVSSPTPERSRLLTKPPRATPDHRRGLRSPNPSPLSPSRRGPAAGRFSPLLPSRDSDGGADLSRLEKNAPVDYVSGDRDRSAMERLEYYDDEDMEGSEINDRWVPDQNIQDNYKAGNGNLYPGFPNRDGRHEESYHKQKRFKGAETSRDDRAEPSFSHGRSQFAPRSEIVRGDFGQNIEDRNGAISLREARTSREPRREDYKRSGDPMKGGRDGSRNGRHLGDARGSDRRTEKADAENGHVMQGFEGGVKEAAPLKPAEELGPTKEPKVERQRPVLPLGRSGGVYIPPFKLAQMLRDVEDKSSPEYQRLTWDALRKSINGLVNKVNGSNLKNILPELFSENLIRGRGLFARSCMKSQMASPGFTHVFAALVAVVNTKFPELGELLLKRIILQLRRAYKRNDKPVLLAAAKFIAHLVNQQVAHEILALQLLSVLLESPTDDSVEVAVGFIKECGSVLQNLSPQGLHGIFERFRGILHEGEIDKRVQFMIEGVFALRKAKFQGFPGVLPELDLVEEQDQITHDLDLDGEFDDESYLDVFKVDSGYVENEKKYEAIKKDILGDESEDDGEDGDQGSEEEDSDEEEDEDELEQRLQIQDETETNLVNLRRTIYLTIMSSVDFEEAGHKLLKIKLEEGQEMELCMMLLECCSQERTYLRYYGLLGQRFCLINKVYQENFDTCFVNQYSMIHRLETNKLRNVAKFFAHLLGTDALPWQALAYIRLTEEDTTSSSRIFIKILFQELSEHLGLRRLNERLSDPMMQESFDGIFPKDNPKNTRFAINFFTSIGLGGLTDSLREYLKNMPRLIMQQPPAPSENDESGSSASDTSAGSDSSDSDTSESDSSSEDSIENMRRGKKSREGKR